MKPDDFIALIGPTAQASAATTTIPASFTIAEAALESGWGESLLAKQGCNLFGVKADASWTGDTLTMPTREVVNGVSVTMGAKWRKYATWQDSIDDHAQFFLKNERYKNALVCVNDSEAFARAIAADHYATDPAYADKIIATMRSHNMAILDGGKNETGPIDNGSAQHLAAPDGGYSGQISVAGAGAGAPQTGGSGADGSQRPSVLRTIASYFRIKPLEQITMSEDPTPKGQVLTNHPAVSVALVVGAITNIILTFLKTKWDLDLSGQESNIQLVMMGLAGYFTKRPPEA